MATDQTSKSFTSWACSSKIPSEGGGSEYGGGFPFICRGYNNNILMNLGTKFIDCMIMMVIISVITTFLASR